MSNQWDARQMRKLLGAIAAVLAIVAVTTPAATAGLA
jgi:hypothetical protein